MFRHYIERYTLFAVLGDLRDRTVLDLACGEGVYTRQFKRADAAAFTPPARVDIVTAVYLLNYARTREELDRLCRACFRALRPGGRLVGFNDNVRNPPRPGVSLAQYGLERTCAYPPREGDVIQYRITNHDGQAFEFENYYLAPATYEAAAASTTSTGTTRCWSRLSGTIPSGTTS